MSDISAFDEAVLMSRLRRILLIRYCAIRIIEFDTKNSTGKIKANMEKGSRKNLIAR